MDNREQNIGLDKTDEKLDKLSSGLDKAKRVKDKLTSRNTLTSISCVILLILLIASTVAWYVLNRTGTGRINGTDVSQWDFVVSTEPDAAHPINGGDTIDVFERSIATAEVEQGKLAPGISGSFKLYISCSSDVASHYALLINKEDLIVDISSDTSAQASATALGIDQDDLTGYLQEHIRFYKDSRLTEEITALSPLEGDIDIQDDSIKNANGIAEVAVDVYWRWEYDGTFLCEDSENIDTSLIAGYDAMTDEQKEAAVAAKKEEIIAANEAILHTYDEEDVLLCNFKDYISGAVKISVSGTQSQPVPIP